MPTPAIFATGLRPSVLRAAAGEALFVAGGAIVGSLGAVATKSAVTEFHDIVRPLWPAHMDDIGKVTAYVTVGALPMGVPFALAAALAPPRMHNPNLGCVVTSLHFLMLGAYAAAAAIGCTGLTHQSPSHAVIYATLAGATILFALEIGVVVTAGAVCVAGNMHPSTRRCLPAPVQQSLAEFVRDAPSHTVRPAHIDLDVLSPHADVDARSHASSITCVER